VRTISKGEEARQEILAQVPESSDTVVEVWRLDLGDFSTVRTFAERAEAELERLDILLCNAGLIPREWELTKDGWETTLQTNCIATFYLSLLLLPLIRRTVAAHYVNVPASSEPSLSQPHLTIVSSALHYMSALEKKSSPNILLELNDPANFNPTERYQDTKVMEVMFARSLTQNIKGSGVLVNTVHPGFCHSGMTDSSKATSIIEYVGVTVLKLILARTGEEGARALVWATLKGNEAGAFSTDCRNVAPSAFVTSAVGVETQERVWNEVLEVLTKLDPSVPAKLEVK